MLRITNYRPLCTITQIVLSKTDAKAKEKVIRVIPMTSEAPLTLHSFFSVTDNSDKALITSVFDAANTSGNKFSFEQKNGALFEVTFYGPSRVILHNFLQPTFAIAKKRSSLMNVAIISNEKKHEISLMYEDVVHIRDETLVCLWNSKSFERVAISISHLKYSRIFTRVDYMLMHPIF